MSEFQLAFDILDAVRALERFGPARMFLLKSDKELLVHIFDALQKEFKHESTILILRTHFYKC